MIRRPPRSTLDRSSAASDVYKRQASKKMKAKAKKMKESMDGAEQEQAEEDARALRQILSLIHISEPTRPY